LYADNGIEGIELTAQTSSGLIRLEFPAESESPPVLATDPMSVDEGARLTTSPARPGDFARILLALCSAPPRARARDQLADLAGETLRRQVLHRLAAIDPDPDSLDETLLAIALEQSGPSGPARGVCTAIRQEWEMARMSPPYWSLLVAQSLEADEAKARTSLRQQGEVHGL
jgi:hypothetical protein